jgi:hypothetical protein
MNQMSRPRVAVITTVYFPDSHADVIASRLIKGYEFQGEHVDPRVEVVSIYLEQISDRDMGLALIEEYNIPRYPTVAEAITCGGTGVNVDGVVIIGEHGDFEYNEYDQKLYPRRRLFDAALSTMIGAGKMVPIFNDKHLSWDFRDAQAMYEASQRLGVPFLAGSTIPLAWRIPTATEWPLGQHMSEIVIAGYGPTEVYGFHNLEGLQVHAERRAGGETGVVAVQALTGEAAVNAVNDGTVNADLLDKALRTFDITDAEREQAKQSAKDVFLVEYADGLRAAVVNCDAVIANFGCAATGSEHEMACQIWLQGYPHGHFIFLTRQIESMILNGVSPYPIERTYLTTGILDAAMHSRHDGGMRRETPELAISYQIPERIADTGVYDPLPEPAPAVAES